MKIKDFTRIQNDKLEGKDLEFAISWIIEKYVSQRLMGNKLDEDGDMLLFQWGFYSWNPANTLEIDLTRQIIFTDGYDIEVRQLRCRYIFSTDDVCEGNNFWCKLPSESESFVKSIKNNIYYNKFKNVIPLKVHIEVINCG